MSITLNCVLYCIFYEKHVNPSNPGECPSVSPPVSYHYVSMSRQMPFPVAGVTTPEMFPTCMGPMCPVSPSHLALCAMCRVDMSALAHSPCWGCCEHEFLTSYSSVLPSTDSPHIPNCCSLGNSCLFICCSEQAAQSMPARIPGAPA